MKTEQLMTFLISPEQTIVEAMQKIDANAKGILFITNTDRKLIGAITEDRKSTRLNSSHANESRMPSSA